MVSKTAKALEFRSVPFVVVCLLGVVGLMRLDC